MKSFLLIIIFYLLNPFQGFSQTYPLTKEWATYTNINVFGLNTAIVTDSKNNVYITKSFTDSDNHNLNSLSKFSPSGELLWTTPNFGSVYGIVITGDDDIIISGLTNVQTGIATLGAFQETFGGGSMDGFLMKISAEGSTIWGTYFGGIAMDSSPMTPYGAAIYFQGLALTSDNEIIWACTTQSDNMATSATFQNQRDGANYLLSKFTADGQRLWSTYYGTADTRYSITGLQVDSSGIYLAGAVENQYTANSYFDTFDEYVHQNLKRDVYVSKFNLSGNRMWSRYLPGNGSNLAKRNTLLLKTNNLYLTFATSSTNFGTSETSFPDFLGNKPGVLAKMDLNGNLDWTTYLPDNGSFADINTGGVYADGGSGIYVMGSTIATPTSFLEMFVPENEGSFTPYVIKFNDQGIMEWGNYVGGSTTNVRNLFGLAFYDSGFYMYAQHGNITDDGIATPGAFQEIPIAQGSNTFLVKYGATALGIPKEDISLFSVYPNPASTTLKINLSNKVNFPTIGNLYNALSQNVASFTIKSTESTVDVSKLSSGIYFLQIGEQNENAIKKIIIK